MGSQHFMDNISSPALDKDLSKGRELYNVYVYNPY
jgi:hypothetical protein